MHLVIWEVWAVCREAGGLASASHTHVCLENQFHAAYLEAHHKYNSRRKQCRYRGPA